MLPTRLSALLAFASLALACFALDDDAEAAEARQYMIASPRDTILLSRRH